ncbi:unnamed protein product [Protopolystoma xenopodis]|uniref:Uncharacterized protein n=1 Tax=Protopolystoma xenopodis TaxID=117903 RepID=A0A3S5BE64_9PLAT|nr:unnamed protein product [Protopolystoma xenopodis]
MINILAYHKVTGTYLPVVLLTIAADRLLQPSQLVHLLNVPLQHSPAECLPSLRVASYLALLVHSLSLHVNLHSQWGDRLIELAGDSVLLAVLVNSLTCLELGSRCAEETEDNALFAFSKHVLLLLRSLESACWLLFYSNPVFRRDVPCFPQTDTAQAPALVYAAAATGVIL